MVAIWRYIQENYVYYGLKQGQITPNIEHIYMYVLKLSYSIAQCSMIANTVSFLKHILHDFPAFWQFSTRNFRMLEGTFCHVEVHIITT